MATYLADRTDLEPAPMRTFLAQFNSGDSATYEAASVNYDHDDSMFYLRDGDGQTVAWLPDINILSIRLQSQSQSQSEKAVTG